MPVLIRLLRRSPLLWYFLLAYAASGVALAVIGLPRLDGSGGRPAASQSVGTLMSSAYQYHPPKFVLKGSNGLVVMIPCRAGETPVTSVVWLV